MNLRMNMPTVIRLLIRNTYNPFTKEDCIEKLETQLGVSGRIRGLYNQKDVLFITALRILNFFNGEIVIRENANEISLASVEEAIRHINSVLQLKSLSKKDYAAKLSVSYVGLMKYFKQPHIKTGTLVKMFNTLGYDVVVRVGDNEYILGEKDYWDYVYAKDYPEALSTFTTKELENV